METIPRDSCAPEIESELTRPLLQNGSLVQTPLSNRSSAQRGWIWLDERISCHESARTLLRWFARELIRLPRRPDVDWVSKLRAELEVRSKRERIASAERQRLRVCAFVLLDLAAHGWSIRVTRRRIQVRAPGNGNSLEDEKGRVRAAHLIERDAQLAHPATARFIRQMERRRLTPNGWKSIFSLMRDGRELADQLFRLRALAVNDVDAAVAACKACIDPYVQVVRPKQVDRFTGLELMDIWRYFRHTWAMAYQTTPGRKLFVLIRDRSAPDHPVIGIGALGSAIVQMSDRDRWIGWDAESFVAALRVRPTKEWAIWLGESLESLLAAVYVRDFLNAHHITRAELRQPTPATVKRLRELAKKARSAHRLFAHVGKHKEATRKPNATRASASSARHWRKQALTYLFQSKRAETLADLLEVRRQLILAGFHEPSANCLQSLLGQPNGVSAIRKILRQVRAAHVGVDMLDITVCGAVAPYSPLLGGKLVSLLLASPEIVQHYRSRYRDAESVIASSMAGRPVRRPPRLVLLGTTSLYGVASSQYNRIVVPADAIGAEMPLRFERVGHTAGYGSYHFSRTTVEELAVIGAQKRRGREVNSIFGEGVNPKLRKVRAALDAVGLPSEELLQHGSPRLIYAVPLATNFREILIGISRRAKYLLPLEGAAKGTQALVDFWIRRWLIPRISKLDILDSVGSHTLVYPVQHGARVPQPAREAERTSVPPPSDAPPA